MRGRGDCAHGDGATRRISRSVREVLERTCPTLQCQSLRRRPAQRQRAEVDAGHARPPRRPRLLPRLQHFIHARWASPPFWKRLREVVPVRTGLLLLDETSFSQAGTTLGRRRPAALRRAGQSGQLPSGGVERVANGRADVATRDGALSPEGVGRGLGPTGGRWEPASLGHREKWRIGLTQIRQIRAAGFTLDGVVADAEYAVLRRSGPPWSAAD